MPGPLRYKAALAVFLFAAPAVARAERVAGALLPDGARRIEVNRYHVEKNYEDTLKFFRTVYPPAKYPRRPIVNQPGIKAVHIDNPGTRPGSWDGLNVYELRGETRVFVLVAPAGEKEKQGRRR
jgi:hypothetical protein